MCGIAGLFGGQYSPLQRAEIAGRMTDAIRHRGPDGGQHYSDERVGLGHRRLSIIAPDESANQPMRRGSLLIIYNGELYNYKEERARLENKGISFRTQSDTEVLLALFEDEGASCFERLDGIFACAIYDESTGRLVCARDQYGTKPFLYSRTGNGLVFASELKALLASGLVKRTINGKAISLLLRTGSVPQPETMVEGVESLLPGHMMVLDGGQVRISQYYKLSAAPVAFHSDGEWREAMHEALKKSIVGQMVSDVPLGAFLSGGVDSGLIAAVMKEKGGAVKTFSVGFEKGSSSDPYDEADEAAAVAKFLETEHLSYIVSDNEASAELANIVAGLDHPTIDGINSYFVSKIAARDVRVALSGTGADEVFGGYAWFGNMLSFQRPSLRERAINLAKGFDFKTYYESLHGAYSRAQAQALLPEIYMAGERYLPDPLANADTVSRTSGLVMGSFLQNQLLPDVDTASMAHGLEVRVPYLSPAVVGLALAVPPHLKIGSPDATAPAASYAAEGTKKILIDIARGYLPAGFDMKPKRGFAMPMARWLATVWKEQMDYYLSDTKIKETGIFSAPVVAGYKALHTAGQLPWTQIWLLLSVQIWADTVLNAKGQR